MPGRYLTTLTMLTILAGLNLSLSSCSDHLSEAEDILEQSQSQQSFDSLYSDLRQEAQMQIQLKFSNNTIGSQIDGAQVQLIAPFFSPSWLSLSYGDSTLIQEFAQEVAQLPSASSDTLTWDMDFYTDSTASGYFHQIQIKVHPDETLQQEETLLEESISPDLLNQCHQVFNQAEQHLADNNNSLLNSLSQSLTNAVTHLKLSLGGSHDKHLKHTAQFLFGRANSLADWEATAPISKDTISVSSQLNYLDQYLVDQASWSDSIHAKSLLELRDTISQFQISLISEMDQLSDWIDMEAPQANDKAQSLITLIETWQPKLDSLIVKVEPHLIKTIHP